LRKRKFRQIPKNNKILGLFERIPGSLNKTQKNEIFLRNKIKPVSR